MFWHIETDVFCLIIIGVLYYDMQRYDLSTLKQDVLFRQIAISMMIVTAVDVAASLAMDFASNVFVYQLLMTLYFVLQPILSVFWFYYSMVVVFPGKNIHRDGVMMVCCIPYFCYTIIALLNPAFGTMFTLGPNMEYTRGPFFSCCVYVFVLYSLLTAAFVVFRYKYIVPRMRMLTLLLSPMLVGVAIWVQLSYSGSLLINAAYTAVFIINSYYIQNRRPQIDGLTGLYSRSSGQQRIMDILRCARDIPAAVLLLDLDNFKQVNDTLGHIRGDETLRSTARAFKAICPQESMAIRIGGDEFLAYIQGEPTREELEASLVSLNETLAEVLPSGSIPEALSASIGVAFFPQDGSTFDELYAAADMALAAAKANGKSRIEFYEKQK